MFSLLSVVVVVVLSSCRSIESQWFNPWASSSWNPSSLPNRQVIRGNLYSNDQSMLPYGSQITISLVDVALQDTYARPLNSVVLRGSYRFPINYEIAYVPSYASNVQQLALQARIEKDGQLLYINDQYTPVQMNGMSVPPINIFMKNVANNLGTFTTRPPGVIDSSLCLLRPDPGFCYASIQQFYYDPLIRACQTFIYGGCAGNQNRFSTREECERTCLPYRRRNTLDNSKRKWIK